MRSPFRVHYYLIFQKNDQMIWISSHPWRGQNGKKIITQSGVRVDIFVFPGFQESSDSVSSVWMHHSWGVPEGSHSVQPHDLQRSNTEGWKQQ